MKSEEEIRGRLKATKLAIKYTQQEIDDDDDLNSGDIEGLEEGIAQNIECQKLLEWILED